MLSERIRALPFRLREQAFLRKQRRRMTRLMAYHRPPGDVEALVAAARAKNLVFTVTAGRTGTTYLQHLLALCPDTTSLHEPEPSFVPVLRLAQRRPALARAFLLEYKLPFILRTPTRSYVETGHPFGKGFLEPLLDLGLVPRIVLLRRAPRRVATSLLVRRTVPGRGKLGLKYLLHPGDPGVLPLPGWTRMSDYQLCFWYALEMERRQRVYGDLLTSLDCAVADATAEELHDPQRFVEVAEQLGLLDARVDRETLLHRHAEVSARLYNYNRRPPAVVVTPDLAEEAVWHAVTPAAPWLRAAIEQRYAPASDVTPLAASRS